MAYATENPLDAIRQVITNFNTAHDLDCLSRTTDSLAFTHESQQMRLAQQVEVSHKLARRLEDHKRRCADERGEYDLGAHHAVVDDLEAEKWRTAKVASKLETEAERLAAEAKALKARLGELNGTGRDPVLGRQGDDETILKLRVYRNMGIDAERDQNTGEYTRAIVRNSQRSDVHVLDLSEEHGDTGTAGLADQVWTCLPG